MSENSESEGLRAEREANEGGLASALAKLRGGWNSRTEGLLEAMNGLADRRMQSASNLPEGGRFSTMFHSLKDYTIAGFALRLAELVRPSKSFGVLLTRSLVEELRSRRNTGGDIPDSE